MSTVTVPMPKDLEDFIEGEVRSGESASKAEVIRTALRFYKEEQAIREIQQMDRDRQEKRFLKGDIDELAHKL